jgi:hypothetical protein
MEFFGIAAAAGRRWKERARVREGALAKIRAGKALETESAEPIQKQIDRLAENTRAPERQTGSVSSWQSRQVRCAAFMPRMGRFFEVP